MSANTQHAAAAAAAEPAGAWVNVEDETPPLGVEVHVDGDYVAEGTGHPLAHYCDCGRIHKDPHFESREWRGMTAVRRWWKPAAMSATETKD